MSSPQPESGNLIFMILLAVVLIGSLSAAIMNSGGSETANIDDENLIIKASQIRSYVGELERGIRYMQYNDITEEEFRFAHADAHTDYGDIDEGVSTQNQMFHQSGGGALYRSPPSGINDGSAWEFFGRTALPSVGSDRADLIALLPNVTQDFCEYINTTNGQAITLDDPSSCINAGASERFSGSEQYDSSPNTVDEASFAQDNTINAVKPALQACVTCSDGTHHFYHVIHAR